MAKSAKDYIEKNDFEGAVQRLEASNKNWKDHWFETCKTIYERSAEWINLYIIDEVSKTFHKIVSLVKKVNIKLRKDNIFTTEDSIIQNNDKNTQKCYLIEFFDKDNQSICSKVGTTVRTIQERIREELNSDTYKKMGAKTCAIHRVYACGNVPAEGLESEFRAKYIRKYPDSFCKNDRFVRTQFDLAEADKIYAEYMAA